MVLALVVLDMMAWTGRRGSRCRHNYSSLDLVADLEVILFFGLAAVLGLMPSRGRRLFLVLRLVLGPLVLFGMMLLQRKSGPDWLWTMMVAASRPRGLSILPVHFRLLIQLPCLPQRRGPVHPRSLVQFRSLVQLHGLILGCRLPQRRGSVHPRGLEQTRSLVQPHSLILHHCLLQRRGVVHPRGLVQPRGLAQPHGLIQLHCLLERRGLVHPRGLVQFRGLVQIHGLLLLHCLVQRRELVHPRGLVQARSLVLLHGLILLHCLRQRHSLMQLFRSDRRSATGGRLSMSRRYSLSLRRPLRAATSVVDGGLVIGIVSAEPARITLGERMTSS